MTASGEILTRLHASSVVAQREFQSLARGLGGYVALAAALVGVAWILGTDLELVRANGLLVQDNTFQAPLLGAVLMLSMFLSISAVVSVARERERGTLEVLFYGPIDEVAYVAGKFMGQLA